MGCCLGGYLERGLEKGLKEGGGQLGKNVNTAEAGQNIGIGIAKGIAEANQPFGSQIGKGIEQGGEKLGYGIRNGKWSRQVTNWSYMYS